MALRDENGRFVKGSTGNPNGRPPRKREERYYQITIETCTFEQWKGIIAKAALQALDGDHQARKFLADYLIGEPQKTIELTGGISADVGINLERLTDAQLRALAFILDQQEGQGGVSAS